MGNHRRPFSHLPHGNSLGGTVLSAHHPHRKGRAMDGDTPRTNSSTLAPQPDPADAPDAGLPRADSGDNPRTNPSSPVPQPDPADAPDAGLPRPHPVAEATEAEPPPVTDATGDATAAAERAR